MASADLVAVVLKYLLQGATFIWVVSHVGQIADAIEKFNAGLVQGVTGPVTNAWVKVVAISAVAGGLIWGAQVWASKKLGVAPPPPPQLAPSAPAAPIFGTSAGLGASVGPVTYQAGVGANAPAFQTAPPPQGVAGRSATFGRPRGRMAAPASRAARRRR